MIDWHDITTCFGLRRRKAPPSATVPMEVNELMVDGDKTIISGGSTGRVELLSTGFARKSPYPGSLYESGAQDIAHEFNIYQAIGPHPRLAKVIDFDHESGLTLEYLPKGNLRAFLLRNNASIAGDQRKIWIADILESVILLHQHRVVHGDLKAENFLLDQELRLRIIDFSGSSLPGRDGTALESVRFCMPRNIEEPSTTQSDIFALGSTIYEVLTGSQPFADLADEKVEALYTEGRFADTRHLEYHEAIQACWKSEVQRVEDVRKMIEDIDA